MRRFAARRLTTSSPITVNTAVGSQLRPLLPAGLLTHDEGLCADRRGEKSITEARGRRLSPT
jgi:hypothetical protein